MDKRNILLPEDFATEMHKILGASAYQSLVEGLSMPSPVSIRLNPFKRKDTLSVLDLQVGRVPWCGDGVYLRERPRFTFDPLLHAGVYYVQEASSMFIHHVIRSFVDHPVRMLDLCAAPGGKSTCAFAALPSGSQLFSNEPIKTRAQILVENVTKFGSSDIYVTNNYAIDYQRSTIRFDVILTDVPCSGEGMFRKDEVAVAQWSLQKVQQCAALQRSIVRDIWEALVPGGLLIYSTCTFNRLENEDNVRWIAEELGADVLTIPVDPEWHIAPSLDSDLAACRFFPGTTQGEGLFMTVLRKHGQYTPTEVTPLSDKQLKRLHLLAKGVKPDVQKGKQLIPDISRALMVDADRSNYPSVEVDESTAIAFLRTEALQLPTDTPRGIVLITFEGSPLGFVKNIGTRANNLYPQAWKIKKTM